MDDSDVSDAGYPISSGAVKRGNRILVTQRLTRSGQSRGHDGTLGGLAFGALPKSGRFDRAWSTLPKSWQQLMPSKPANDDQALLAHAA